jgi:hypothetical protein
MQILVGKTQLAVNDCIAKIKKHPLFRGNYEQMQENMQENEKLELNLLL